MKRARITVRWDRTAREWVIAPGFMVPGTEPRLRFQYKGNAVSMAALCARSQRPSELYVYTKAGRIGERRTYQGDPEKSRG